MGSDSTSGTATNMPLPEPLSQPCAIDELADHWQRKHSASIKEYTHLPEELLEMIINAVDPLPNAREPPHWPSNRYTRRTWLACSSVSRQFHRLVLPYLFYSVEVNETRYVRFHEYAQFYTNTPWIATHVHHVTMQFPTKLLDIKEFDWLLRSLPNLSYFTALDVEFFVREPGTYYEKPPSPSPIRGHTLQRLTFRDVEETGRQYKHFADALALFADVEELEITGRSGSASFYYEEMARAIWAGVSAARAGSLKVRKLVLSQGYTIPAFVVSVLLPTDAFDHLSSLTYAVNNSDLFRNLSLVLHNVGPSLEFLSIAVVFQRELTTSDEAISKICSGLSRCEKLNECCIEVNVPAAVGGTAVDLGQNSAVVPRGWKTLSELVTLVPPGDIHRLSLVFYVGGPSWHVNPSHNLPWEPMKKALHRFPNVQTLKMQLYTANSIGEDCVAYEMQEFAGVLDSNIPTSKLPKMIQEQCDSEGCVQHSKSKTEEHV